MSVNQRMGINKRTRMRHKEGMSTPMTKAQEEWAKRQGMEAARVAAEALSKDSEDCTDEPLPSTLSPEELEERIQDTHRRERNDQRARVAVGMERAGDPMLEDLGPLEEAPHA